MRLFGKPSAEDDRRAVAYRDWLARQNAMAIVSAVLGAASLFDLGAVFVVQLAGLVTGVIALSQLSRGAGALPRPVRAGGHRLAWAGIALSSISLVIATALYRWNPNRSHLP